MLTPFAVGVVGCSLSFGCMLGSSGAAVLAEEDGLGGAEGVGVPGISYLFQNDNPSFLLMKYVLPLEGSTFSSHPVGNGLGPCGG